MPKTIWNGPGIKPPLVPPKIPVAQMRQRRNRYKLVRRSDKWVVRARFLANYPDQEWLESSGAIEIRCPVNTDSEWVYLSGPQRWDFDFWFRTRGEAIMFMMRCE